MAASDLATDSDSGSVLDSDSDWDWIGIRIGRRRAAGHADRRLADRIAGARDDRRRAGAGPRHAGMTGRIGARLRVRQLAARGAERDRHVPRDDAAEVVRGGRDHELQAAAPGGKIETVRADEDGGGMPGGGGAGGSDGAAGDDSEQETRAPRRTAAATPRTQVRPIVCSILHRASCARAHTQYQSSIWRRAAGCAPAPVLPRGLAGGS